MKQTVKLLLQGFESSTGPTPEFLKFFNTFKKEFTKELESIKAKDILFHRGHFYISGFFTIDKQVWYFNLGDVRQMDYVMKHSPDSCMAKLMYRTAKDNKDYTGGQNRYAKIEPGMGEKMCWSFKLIE